MSGRTATTHMNLAVTKDGEAYNKLSRPDHYLTSATPVPPPRPIVPRPATPSFKRKRGDDTTGNKRMKEENDLRTVVLPGLDGDVASLGEPVDEALAYLRSVRSEALTIPPLLAAPTSDERENAGGRLLCDGIDSQDGAMYHDGVWMALEGGSSNGGGVVASDDAHSLLQPQRAYYEALLARFQSLRAKLRDAGFVGGHGGAQASPQQPDSRWTWLEAIDQDFPTSNHLGQLAEPDLFLALDACSASLGHSTTLSRETSSWIWTLLALVGEAGTLDNSLIGKIRHLGLQAGRLRTRLHAGTNHQHHRGETDSDQIPHALYKTDSNQIPHALYKTDSNQIPHALYKTDSDQIPHALYKDGQDGGTRAQTLERARAHVLAQLGDRLVPSGGVPHEEEGVATDVSEKALDGALDWNTKATIDMVLTVVAECYGQRDLLKDRVAW